MKKLGAAASSIWQPAIRRVISIADPEVTVNPMSVLSPVVAAGLVAVQDCRVSVPVGVKLANPPPAKPGVSRN